MCDDDFRSIDWDPINRRHDQMLAAVNALDGRAWRESAGELHSQFLEMPFWILVEEGCDLVSVHCQFVAIVAPHFDAIAPVKCTVAYNFIANGRQFQRAYFNNNDQIVRARPVDLIDEEPIELDGLSSMFRSISH